MKAGYAFPDHGKIFGIVTKFGTGFVVPLSLIIFC